jgi:hypothetical protein
MTSPTKPKGRQKVRVNITLTPKQRAEFLDLGGSRWLQRVLDRLSKQVPRTESEVL